MKPTAKIITAGLIGAIIGAGLVYIKTGHANDDDPILMAGGSLHFFTHTAKLKKNGRAAVHSDKKYVSGVDIIAGSPLALTSLSFNKQQVEIDMPYCADDNCTTSDTVTIQTDANGQGLTISDQNGTVGDEINGTELTHQPDGGHVQQIRITGAAQPYVCSNGRCFFLIHYCSTANCK